MYMQDLEKIPKASELRCVTFQFTFHGGYSLTGIGLDGWGVKFWNLDYSTTVYDDEVNDVLKYLLEHNHRLSEFSIFAKKYEKIGGKLYTSD